MLLPHSAAFQAPGLSAATRSAVLRAEPAVMDGRLNRKVITFDYNGVFEGREKSIEKDPVKPLTRLNELQALTKIADAGLLSSAEQAGVFSKLESAGAFSAAEKVLPILDQLNLLAAAESVLNVPANLLAVAGLAVLTGEAGVITVVPDDNAALIAFQVLTGLLAGAGGVTLIASSVLLSLLQGKDGDGR